MEKSKVSIIINNFKTTKHLGMSLQAHQKESYPNSEIIVVDSCTPNFDEWIKKYQNIKYVHSDTHLGPCVGKNVGFQQSDPNSQYICFMDDDVIVTPNWLSNMVQEMEQNKKIGAISPILLDYNDKSKIDSLGHLMTYTGYQYKIPCNDENLAKLKTQKNMDIFYAETAVVLVRRDLLNRLSESGEPLDGDYFIHWYDIDLSWRIWLMGYRVIITAESICYHDRGISSGAWKLKDENIFIGTRNRLITLLKYYEKSYLFKFFPLTICLEFLRGLALLSKRPSHAKATFKAIFWVLFHPSYIYKKRKKSRLPLTESNDSLKGVFVKTSISHLLSSFKRNYPIKNDSRLNIEMK